MSKSKFKTLRGVIYPVDWDDIGNVMGVVLTTDDDEEYFIEPVGKGNYLVELVDEYVEVRGTVHNDDGEYTITVRQYRQIDENEDEDEDKSYEEDLLSSG